MSGTRCFHCGYDLGGMRADGRCPECGHPAQDEREVLDHRTVVGRRRRFVIQVTAITVFALLFLSCLVGALIYD